MTHFDTDGNGLMEMGIAEFTGNSGKFTFQPLPDLNGNTCGWISGDVGQSAFGIDIDDAGHTVVGMSRPDPDGDGVCLADREARPIAWRQQTGLQQLPTLTDATWSRPTAVYGNGRVNGGASAPVVAPGAWSSPQHIWLITYSLQPQSDSSY